MKRRLVRSTTAIALLALLVAVCGPGSAVASTAAGGGGGGPLGPKNAASGAPVKLGVITEGENPTTDDQVSVDTAEATVEYLNEHKAGLGGREIDLVLCEAKLDPALTTDCANQMVQEGVVAVVIGGLSNQPLAHQVLKDAAIPTLWTAAQLPEILEDTQNSFAMFNALAATVDLPIATAKANKLKKQIAFIVDVPAAKESYADDVVRKFKKAGIDLEVVPLALDQADFTGVPEIQDLAGKSDVATHFVAFDSFCIGAFNALQALGYKGPKSSNAQCITDATREAVPADFLEGLSLVANAPTGTNKLTKLYRAMIKKYNSDIDPSQVTGASMFTTMSALQAALANVKGELNPTTVTEALKTMKWTTMPGMGGLHFRCNGKAVPERPALCVRGALRATLDADGQLGEFEVIGDTKIPD
jgi:branched-chain amino acid transport system substrate-binding protein